MLWAAKLVGLCCVEEGSDRTIRPCQSSLAWLVKWSVKARVYGEDSAISLNEHVTGISGSFGDKSKAPSFARAERG